jgi:hypothetical protein
MDTVFEPTRLSAERLQRAYAQVVPPAQREVHREDNDGERRARPEEVGSRRSQDRRAA